MKLQKETSAGDKQYYLGGIEYSGTNLDAIYHEEGFLEPDGANFDYYYYLKDHLGNNRVVFHDSNGNGTITSSEITQENHYYPFGMDMQGSWTATPTDNYKYNNKELNEDFRLNWYDYGARWYMADIGRWGQVDPLAIDYNSWNPYHYSYDNPIRYFDPNGASIEDKVGVVIDDVQKAKKLDESIHNPIMRLTSSPFNDIYLNREGKVTKVDEKDEPHRVFMQDDYGYHELTFNDPETDQEELGYYREGDQLLSVINAPMMESIMRYVGAGSNEGNIISNSFGKYDFAYSILNAHFPNEFAEEVQGRTSRSNYISMGGFYLFGESYRAYNIHDAGNFLWGFANQRDGHGIAKLKLGAHANEISNGRPGDRSADQWAILNGFVYSKEFSLPPNTTIPKFPPR